MKLSFKNFLETSFGNQSPFDRRHLGIFHNFIKWLSLRFAYFFYRFGIDANTLDLIGFISLIPAYFLLYLSIIENNILFFLLSYLIISFCIFIDFIDGPLAKVNKYKYVVGEKLDNLSPDIVKFMSHIFLGVFCQNVYLFVLSILTAIIISRYVRITTHAISNNNSVLFKIFINKLSLNSIRILVFLILPMIAIIFFIEIRYASMLASIFVIFFYLMSILWILVTFKKKLKK